MTDEDELSRPGWVGMLAACGMAAGCSSSDGSASFEDLVSDYDALAAEIDALPIVQPSDLPTSGSATYEGVMGFDTSGEGDLPLSIAGDLSLTADFGAGEVSGRVDDLVTDLEEDLGGSLSITPLDDEDAADEGGAGPPVVVSSFGFDMAGTLTDPEGTGLVVEAEGYGDYFGEAHSHVAGILQGTIASPGAASVLAGGFVGER